MEEFTPITALRGHLAKERAAGRTVALVATMGYLHAGHLRLVDTARQSCDVVVLSAFVNPLQFGPSEDFGRYPRDPRRDRELAAGRGVDILFSPSAEEMYPAGSDLRIAAGGIGSRLEGIVRPGHFDGVLTVVAKLFNIVSPDVTCFGQKDIQQVTLVRRMIRELDFPIRLVVVPTEREPDGLAMSSRNVYLSAAERASALALSRALQAAHGAWQSGERRAERLHEVLRHVLNAEPGVAMDYAAIVDPESLQPVVRAESGAIVALAARVGKTRLIDNLILGEPG
ncbi:MAG TPA: pantoate--beta-alanine ligase [Gemmatimonadales bacterium]